MPKSTVSRRTPTGSTPYATPIDHLGDVRELVRLHAQMLKLSEAVDGRMRHFSRGPDPDIAEAKLPKVKRKLRDLKSRITRREQATTKAGTHCPSTPCDTPRAVSSRPHGDAARVADRARPFRRRRLSRCDSTRQPAHRDGGPQIMQMTLPQQLAARAGSVPMRPCGPATSSRWVSGRRATSPEDLLRADISLTPQALALILGDDQLSDELVEFSSIEAPLASFDRVVLPNDDLNRILAIVDGHEHWHEARASWGLDRTITYGRGSFLLFSGPPGTGKTLTAHAVAHRLGKRVLSVDIPTLVEHVDNMRLLPGLFREARLRGAVLFFDECETFFESRRRGNQLMTILLTELERFDGIAVMATNLPENLDDALFRRLLVHVRFEAPAAPTAQPSGVTTCSTRRLSRPTSTWTPSACGTGSLAGRSNATLNAFASAYTRRGAEGPVTMADLERAARDQLRPLVHREDHVNAEWSPDVRLDAVHLPDHLHHVLHEFLGMAREQRLIREEWVWPVARAPRRCCSCARPRAPARASAPVPSPASWAGPCCGSQSAACGPNT